MRLIPVTVKLAPTERFALEERARAEDRTLSSVVRRALRDSLAKWTHPKRDEQRTPDHKRSS
jgi:hypothetical protein